MTAGWRTAPLRSLCHNIIDYRGRTPKKLGMEWGGGDIPALSARNVKMGYIDFEEECYFGSDDLYRRWMTNGDAKKDDLVVTLEAPLGNVALIPDDRRYILSQRAILLQLNPDQAFGRYLFQFMMSPAFQRVLLENATGSTAQGIKRKKLETLPVPLPPVSEQRMIAAALGDVDALIDAMDRMIAKKRRLKHAGMQRLLTGETRLPGFSGAWSSTKLGACLLARPDYGINAPAVPFTDTLPAYLRITDISAEGRFEPDAPASVLDPNAEKYFLNAGDLVFARTGASVGKSYLYDPRDGPLVFAGFLIRVRPDPAVLIPAYLAAVVTSGAYWRWVRLMSMRSGQPGINGNEYAQLELTLPPPAEQIAIAQVLGDMEAELAGIEQRRDKTRLLKQGMMQALLTGRTRLV